MNIPTTKRSFVLTTLCLALYTLALLQQNLVSAVPDSSSFGTIPTPSVFDSDITVIEPNALKNYAIPSSYAVFTELPPPGTGVEGYVSIANPPEACTSLTNKPTEIQGTIVVVNRGGCEFYRKALNVLEAGGIAFLASNVVDDVLPVPAWGSEGFSEILPLYGASIPGKDGNDLIQLVKEQDIAVKLRLTGPLLIGSIFP